jgi:hypothetical protein
MDALDQSDELIQRGAELRARSVRACAAADKQMEHSRRLIVAAAKANRAVLRAHGREPWRARSGSFARHGSLLTSLPWVHILRTPLRIPRG